MQGIVGIVTQMPRARAERELRRMVEAICHQPSDVAGTWHDESLGLYVGWVARQGSFSDGMPSWNERRDVLLVFSGEEFPAPGTAQRLRERGHDPASGPAAHLVHLYEEHSGFPASLNGRFHGVIADRSRAAVMLFNDRYGMHRLYHHQATEGWYFAAEAKALLAVRPELRHVDVRGLGEFISCGCVLENRTLFQSVKLLPGASRWVFRNGTLENAGKYFDPREWENLATLKPAEYYEQLVDVFSRCLPRYFEGGERVAMSLTGGLDTRMIMAWHKAAPGSLPCYTYSSLLRESQDVVIGRRIARATRQPYHVIPAGNDFLSRFSGYAERTVYLTDGCADVSHAPDLYCSERAREIAPVRLTGLYGSEVLRRVVAFKPKDTVSDAFAPELRTHSARATYESALHGHPLSFAVFRQAPWHHYGPLAIEETQLTVRSPYLDNGLVRTVFQAPDSACTDNSICLRLIADGDSALRRIRTDRGLGGAANPFASRVSQALLQFLFKAEYACDYGMPQWLAELNYRAPILPKQLFLGWHRPFHFRQWYQGALSAYVREVLLDERALSRAYVEREVVKSIVNLHLSGRRNYTTEIHNLLTLELLHRSLIDGPASPRAARLPSYACAEREGTACLPLLQP